MFYSFQLVLSVKIFHVMWFLLLNYLTCLSDHIHAVINSTHSIRQAPKKAEQARKHYFYLTPGIPSPISSVEDRIRFWGYLY